MSEELKVIISADDKASGVLQGIQGTLGGIGRIAGGVLKLGLAGATVGFGALTAGIGASVKAAMGSEKATAQLDAVLKSTKGAAGVTRKGVLDLADSFSQVTEFEDDAILAGQNLLLTFTNIGKDVFPDATETMLDMSAALGQDLKSSAVQLGKALQDPIQGVSALSRVGVNFTDAQKAQIKAMVESGDVMGAQKLILAELKTEFGGAAKAAGETFGGQLTILQNNFGNVLETIGGAFLPSLKDLTGFVNQNLLPAFKMWAEENAPKIQEGLKAIGDIAGGLAKGDFSKLQTVLTTGLDAAKKAFEENAPKYAAAFWAFTGIAITQISAKFAELTTAMDAWISSKEGNTQLSNLGGGIARGIMQAIGFTFATDETTHASVTSNIGIGLGKMLAGIPKAIALILAGMGSEIGFAFANGISNALFGTGASQYWKNIGDLWIQDIINKIFGGRGTLGVKTAFSTAGLGGSSGVGFQTEPGQFRIVPGAMNQGVPAIVHGGEIIGRPSFGGFGGGNVIVQLTYAPALSLADEREFRDRLQPFIEEGIVAARRRQV